MKHRAEYDFLPREVQACFAYAQAHDLASFETGSHAIDGERLFVNIVEYETTAPENRFWEAHRAYLDLHLMLRGAEQIDGGFIDCMECKPFVPEEDFLPLEGEGNAAYRLREGDFLLCYPQDAHRTAVQIDRPARIKKAIFKIKLD